MKKSISFLTIILLGLATTLQAQINHLTKITFLNHVDEYQCRIFSSKQVPFGSIWLPESKRLVVYVRESKLEVDVNTIQPEEGPIELVSAEQVKDDPQVVEITLDFKENRKYSIDYDGSAIVIYIEGEKPLAMNSFSSAQKTSERIERKGPLYNPSRITMDYREADLPNVLRLLSKQNQVNIVAGSDVTGNITISLRNVTLKETLDNILIANGYDYVMNENVILVKSQDKFMPSKLQTKVYNLKYINAQNFKNVIQDLISTDAKSQVFSSEFYSTKDDNNDPALQKDDVKRRSSTLIITALPEIIDKIDQLVVQLDVPIPQIVIESKLLELAPVNNDKLGIDWDKTITANFMYEDILPSGETQKYSAYNDGLRQNNSWKLGHLSAGQFSAVLDFLRENTDSKLVSNPRILAMDNQLSTISVGTTYPVPQINRGLAGQGDIVTFNYKDVNIQLNVTPHVIGNKEIIMYVNPVIEEITGEVVIDVNRAPITSKRIVNTVVTVKDGETIVIGGMIKEDQKRTVSKVFLLGDIPLLGNLFRHVSLEKQQKDLVIFITPHILK